MTNFLIFVIFGLASGALTALVALGVVVVFRSSGVVNFSAAAMGALGAYVCYSLRDYHSVPSALALVIGLLVGALMGLLTHGAMALLRRASQLARLMVTLGLFTSAQAFILIAWGPAVRVPDSFLPTHRVKLTGSVVISEDRLLLIGLALLLTIILVLVYTKTMFGLATSAIAESRTFAASSGWSTGQIEMINHVVAGVLAAAAAIFLAPIVGLSGAILAIVILPALAAALVGRFAAFGITVGAALAIGIAESEISLYESNIAGWLHVSALSLSGLPQAVPLLIIVLLTVFRGRAQLQRGETQARLPLPGNGAISLVPLTLGVGAAVLLLAVDQSWGDAMVAFTAGGMLLLSVVLVTGYAGQLSLCQFALAGFGGWASAKLSSGHGVPLLVSLVLGVITATAVGLVVALPALRARGVDLAVATLGLALLLNTLIFTNSSLTGGFNGIAVSTPSIFGLDLDPLAHPARYAGLGLVLLVLCGLVVANLRRGRSGRRLLAVRSDERAAASLGVGIYGAKLFAFAVASGIAGLAGTYLAFQFPSAQFTGYDALPSVTLIQNSVLGGLGWVSGIPAGAMASAGSVLSHATHVELLTVHNVDSWLSLFTGLLLVLVLRRSPDGVASVWARAFNSPRSEAVREHLSVPVLAWRTLGMTEILVGLALIIGIIRHGVGQIAAIVVIALMVLRIALHLRARDGISKMRFELIIGFMAVVIVALRGSNTVSSAVIVFIFYQAMALPLITGGIAKLSGRLVALLRFPHQGGPDAARAGTGPGRR